MNLQNVFPILYGLLDTIYILKQRKLKKAEFKIVLKR